MSQVTRAELELEVARLNLEIARLRNVDAALTGVLLPMYGALWRIAAKTNIDADPEITERVKQIEDAIESVFEKASGETGNG